MPSLPIHQFGIDMLIIMKFVPTKGFTSDVVISVFSMALRTKDERLNGRQDLASSGLLLGLGMKSTLVFLNVYV